MVDNTLLSAYYYRPLELGAYLAISSLTKHISGSGNSLGGVVVSNDRDYIHKLKFMYMCQLGCTMSPYVAHNFLQGLETLSCRLEKQTSTATIICDKLCDYSGIK